MQILFNPSGRILAILSQNAHEFQWHGRSGHRTMEWIERTPRDPEREHIQADGRIRRWKRIPEAEGKALRVVLLEDGEIVHNAFFDRRFEE